MHGCTYGGLEFLELLFAFQTVTLDFFGGFILGLFKATCLACNLNKTLIFKVKWSQTQLHKITTVLYEHKACVKVRKSVKWKTTCCLSCFSHHMIYFELLVFEKKSTSLCTISKELEKDPLPTKRKWVCFAELFSSYHVTPHDFKDCVRHERKFIMFVLEYVRLRASPTLSAAFFSAARSCWMPWDWFVILGFSWCTCQEIKKDTTKVKWKR